MGPPEEGAPEEDGPLEDEEDEESGVLVTMVTTDAALVALPGSVVTTAQ